MFVFYFYFVGGCDVTVGPCLQRTTGWLLWVLNIAKQNKLNGWAVLYCLYVGIPLFTNRKNVTHENVLLRDWYILPSQPLILLSLIKNPPQSK